ncbi:MAG TPA: hypothetical protein VK550_23570 [Polyangiaceae bacterium]|nr:hypothetical protein [Polyangiaceae bacterium]
MRFLCGTAASLLIGCSSTPVEVGSNIGDSEDMWWWTDEKACAAGPQLSIVGTWTGHTDVQRSPSGSDAVRLVISHANGKRVCGTLTFGREAAAWPSPSDSDVVYPPELSDTVQSSFGTYLAGLEGVPRTITAGRVVLPRLWFRASYAQWKDWCALQTPYRCEGLAMDEYYCVPASGPGGLSPRVRYTPGVGCVTDYGGESLVVDCGKAMLCLGGPCTCTATRCVAPPLWGSEYELELDGDTAKGAGMYLTRSK